MAEVFSLTLNTSRPARSGFRSPICMASPWPMAVLYSLAPLSSTVKAPYTISSLPSPSTSPTLRLWLPCPAVPELVELLLSKVHLRVSVLFRQS
ncbi:hypothetical protein D3C75_791110 [compost metagenome]